MVIFNGANTSRAFGWPELSLWACCILEAALGSGFWFLQMVWDLTAQKNLAWKSPVPATRLNRQNLPSVQIIRADPRELLRWQISKKKTMLAVRVPGITERIIYFRFISLPPTSPRRSSPTEMLAMRMWLLHRELMCAGGRLGIPSLKPNPGSIHSDILRLSQHNSQGSVALLTAEYRVASKLKPQDGHG